MRWVPVTEPLAAWSMRVKERWFCAWCYAWTELGYLPGEVARPQYEPVNRRCEWHTETETAASSPRIRNSY